MEKKKVSMSTFLIIVGIIVIGTLACWLVILMQNKSNIELDKKQLEENMAKMQEQVQVLQKEKNELQDKIDIITNTITTKNATAEEKTQAEQKNEGIKIEKDEFTLTLPKSWEGKYEIRLSHEETDIKHYNFISTASKEAGMEGYLFGIDIIPSTEATFEAGLVYNRLISAGRYLAVYIPTDITYSEDDENYDNMYNDVETIINTIIPK